MPSPPSQLSMEELAFAYLSALHDDDNKELAFSIKEEMISRAGNHPKIYIEEARETRAMCGFNDTLKIQWFCGLAVKC